MKTRASCFITVAVVLFVSGTAFSQAKISSGKAREENAYALGIQAYVWGYPIVIADGSRQAMTSVTEAQEQKAPVNQVAFAKKLFGPEFKAVQSANNDTIYCLGWLDLSGEPMILELPDFKGRFYTFQFVDHYTNNFTYVSQRTKGFKKQSYAVCGPGWSGKLPPGMKRINSPTIDVFMVGRLGVSGPADLPAVYKMQDKIRVTPLSKYGSDYKPGKVALVTHKNYKGPFAFYEKLGDLIARNRPPKSDEGLVATFTEIGLSPDYGFDPSKIDEPTKRGLKRALAVGESILAAKAKSIGRKVNGWQYAPVADEYFGTDYLFRAVMGWQSMYVNNPSEAYYPAVYVDADDNTLDASKHNYVLHFEKGQIPPVDAFWSVTIYDLQNRLMVPNSLKRYSIGDRTKGLKYGKDGSLTIYIQNKSPGKENESNWLPAPDAAFYMLLRMYLPRQEVLNGQYAIPPVAKQ